MADIFRAPQFLGKREFAPVLAVAVFLCPTPKTLIPDKQLPVGIQSYPPQFKQLVWLLPDTTRGTAKGLIPDNQVPVGTQLRPEWKKTIWLLPDSTRGTPKALTADKQLPFFNAQTVAPTLWRINPDTSIGSDLSLQAIVVMPPGGSAYTQTPPARWLLPDTSRGVPETLLPPSAIPSGKASEFAPIFYPGGVVDTNIPVNPNVFPPYVPPPVTTVVTHSWYVKGIGIKTKIVTQSQVDSDTGDVP